MTLLLFLLLTLQWSPPGFTLERQIALDDSVLVGTVDQISIGPDGELLVTDQTAQQVFLFDRDGRHLRTLDPAECHPGFTMNPIGALYLGDTILLMNSGPWGYLFDHDGTCIKAPDESFRPMPGLAWDGVARLYGYDGGDAIQVMNVDGVVVDKINLPAPNSFPNIDRRVIGGGIVADAQFVYHASVSDYRIVQIDNSSGTIEHFGRRPKGYAATDADLPANISRDFAERVGNLMRRSTITTSLLELDHVHLILQFKHGDRGRGYQVWTKSGEMVTEHYEDTPDHRFFDHAVDGRTYRVVQPNLDDEGNLPNPVIAVYSWDSI